MVVEVLETLNSDLPISYNEYKQKPLKPLTK